MFVVATAGHVDHGKSTLVRALTGSDPDRLAEEHRRGMTIELGYAWTDLPAGRVAFVDVPGHERFLGTMIAGVGPVPAVLLVVAADEGWGRQTGEHVAALHALGVEHAVLAVTRADLADPAPTAAQTRERLAGTPLAGLPWVGVSAYTGAGLPELRAALDDLVRSLPAPPTVHRTRLFVDRVFAMQGAGTVVTGTLQGGTVRIGDRLEVEGRPVTIRALESCREAYDEVRAVARVAVNLRGIGHGELRRGAALVSPHDWVPTTSIDVRLQPSAPKLPRHLVLHVASAAVPVVTRLLGDSGDYARLSLAHALPLQPADRGVLRDPGRHAVAAGIEVLDIAPPPLTGRGVARARAGKLAAGLSAADVLARHGAMRSAELARLGWTAPPGSKQVGSWLVDPGAWQRWGADLVAAVRRHRSEGNATQGPSAATLARSLPAPQLLEPLAAAHQLTVTDGRVVPAGATRPALPPELADALERLKHHLAPNPFAAPDQNELARLGLDHRTLSGLTAAKLVLRLPGDIALLPDAPERAAEMLARLEGPFTLSQGRQALGITRRVAVPLFEHLDRIRVTVRVDDTRRKLRDRRPTTG